MKVDASVDQSKIAVSRKSNGCVRLSALREHAHGRSTHEDLGSKGEAQAESGPLEFEASIVFLPCDVTKSPLTHRERKAKERWDGDETCTRRGGHKSRTRDPLLVGVQAKESAR